MEAALDTGARFNVDDLLNFNFGDGGEENDDENTQKAPYTFPLETLHPCIEDPDDHQGLALPEFAEEELEWLSNKDAFPAVETCLDILAESPSIVLNHHSPVSVLDNSSSSNGSTITSCCSGAVSVPIRYPMKARSKRRQRRKRSGFSDLPAQQFLSWGQVNAKNNAKQQSEITVKTPSSAKIGRRCTHCLAEKTPQWRAGPMGPKTLCNACGVRYKSGRLVPEYRPASSPTFSNMMHSNSHRKIVEMRKQKQLGGLVVNEPCAYRVG